MLTPSKCPTQAPLQPPTPHFQPLCPTALCKVCLEDVQWNWIGAPHPELSCKLTVSQCPLCAGYQAAPAARSSPLGVSDLLLLPYPQSRSQGWLGGRVGAGRSSLEGWKERQRVANGF